MFVRVNQRIINGGRETEALIFLETDYADMDELNDVLVEDGTITGIRHYTRSGERHGEYIITESGPTVLADYIVSVQHMKGTLVDSQGRVVWPRSAKAGRA